MERKRGKEEGNQTERNGTPLHNPHVELRVSSSYCSAHEFRLHKTKGSGRYQTSSLLVASGKYFLFTKPITNP